MNQSWVQKWSFSMNINSNVLMPYIMGGGGGLEHGKKVKPVLSFFFSFSFYLLFCLLFCFQSERVMLFVKQVRYNPLP